MDDKRTAIKHFVLLTSFVSLLFLGQLSQASNSIDTKAKFLPNVFHHNTKVLPRNSSGQYLDIQALKTGRATVETTPFLVGLQSPKLQLRAQNKQYAHYQIRSAPLSRQNQNGNLAGSLILVTYDGDSSFVALVDTPEYRGTIIGKPDGTQTFLADKETDFLKPDTISSRQPSFFNATPKSIKNRSAINRNGEYVVTVMIGFSQAAANKIGNSTQVTAYALTQVESANRSLQNAQVQNVRLVLRDIGFSAKDYPITGATLSNLTAIFPNFWQDNLMAGFFIGNQEDTAAGWAFIPGRQSIQALYASTAFRHEVAHNAGGDHCNYDNIDNFRFGYNTGAPGGATCLCGNDLSVYSTPNTSYFWNNILYPLGNARTADMARQWRERAPILASQQGQPFIQLQNKATSQCANVVRSDPVVDAQISLAECQKGNSNQVWSYNSSGHIALVKSLPSNQNLCLGYRGSYAVLKDCHSTSEANQIIWKEQNNKIINLSNNQCLGYMGSHLLSLTPCNNSNSQNWVMIPQ